MAPLTAIHFLFFVCLSSVAAKETVTKQQPSTIPVAGLLTSQGCYKSLPSTADDTPNNSVYTSVGSCGNYCQEAGKPVAIVQERLCYCADTYPPQSSLVDDLECYRPCPGYAPDACGGEGVYSVFNTGIDVDVRHDGAGTPASESSVATSTAILTTAQSATSSSSSVAETSTGENSSIAKTSTGENASTTVSAPSNSASTDKTKSEEAVPSPSPTTVEQTNDSSRGLSNVAIGLKNRIQGLFSKSSGRQALKGSASSQQKSGGSGSKAEL